MSSPWSRRRAAKQAGAEATAGFAAARRWSSTHDLVDLDAAIDHFNAWREWSDKGRLTDHVVAYGSGVRGLLLVQRGLIRDDLDDLDAGLSSMRPAVRSGYLSPQALTDCTRSTMEATWAQARLTASVSKYDDAIALYDASPRPIIPPARFCRLLVGRYGVTGNQADLDRALEMWSDLESARCAHHRPRTADEARADEDLHPFVERT